MSGLDGIMERAMQNVTIGANVENARGGMSQRELAKGMQSLGWNWSHVTVGAVERGERPLRLAEASALANLLGVSILRLAGEDDSEAALRDKYIDVRDALRKIEIHVINAREGGLLG